MIFLSSENRLLSRSITTIAPAFLLFTGYATAAPADPSAKPVPQWTFHDYFRHDWRNELVKYPVDAATAASKNQSLLGADGVPHAYQWLKEGDQTKIAFLADVPADGTSTYHLAAGQPTTQTDLKIEESADEIRLSNDQTGVAIRKALNEGEAPISAIRLASGKWIGGSQRSGTPALQSYTAKVVERGPVLCEVLCEAKFEGAKTWRMRFRLLANEPVVTVSEISSAGAGANWRLRLDNGFAPTQFYRNPVERTPTISPISNGTIGIVEPWLRWSEPNHSTWLSLYNDAGDDLLTLGAMSPSLWVDVDKLHAQIPQSKAEVPVVSENGAVYANFDLTGGVRKWLIASLGKAASLPPAAAPNIAAPKISFPHTFVVKYGDFPLDRVKDYVLDWPETAEHPRLMVNRDDMARLRRVYKPEQLVKATPSLTYLATGDERVGRGIAAYALQLMQDQTDSFLLQTSRGGLGAMPHLQQGISTAFSMADVAWPAFTPEERRRIRAQAALIGYTVNSPDYWSVERGFRANPNMTTMVAGYQASAGYLLADHPESEKWIDAGMAEAKQQIDKWADANGGWLEAPHYATVSYDHLLGVFAMARAKDNGALLLSDKMKQVATFFAKIATPPDVHVGGIRHQPRIGNTWLDEPCSGIFAILAAVWKDRDPKFASEMQWMYQQQGSRPDNCIGGGCGSFEGVQPAFVDPSIVPAKPDYGSTLFPETGVSLRNGVDDRETQLYLISGWNHEHYDDDSGSITLWGKGRVIANDFSYAQAAGKFHNLIEGGGRQGLMHVKNFRTTPQFDSVRGVSGDWTRQIAFVKDGDMMAPNYFVLRDTPSPAAASTWRLWLDGKVNLLDPKGNGEGTQVQMVQVQGRDDVDTDIALISTGGVSLTTEDKTSKLYGLGADGAAGADREFSLTGLSANLAAGQELLAVVFPRLKTQKPSQIQIIAGGRAVKIDHEAGTDYVFLNSTPFDFNTDGIQFQGTSGVVEIRGAKVDAILGEAGKLEAKGQIATAP